MSRSTKKDSPNEFRKVKQKTLRDLRIQEIDVNVQKHIIKIMDNILIGIKDNNKTSHK